eukprot:c13053_g2_i4.p1 GENE.c13053_g2_i4~~c13053_g2_i4.p1  ORF type:complete len:356 (-),score=103.84 c13053_g2_i4:163-1230(-)
MLQLVWFALRWYFILAFLQCLFRIVSNIFLHYRALRDLKNIPGDRGHWLFGLMKEVGKNFRRNHDFTVDRLNGARTVAFRLASFFPYIRIDTIDPVLTKHILKDKFEVWNKTPTSEEKLISLVMFGEFFRFNMHGAHAPDKGRTWQLTRKIAASIFTRNNFKDLMRDVFVDKAKVLVDNLLQVTAQEHKVVDIQEKFFAFTIDSSLDIFFGSSSAGGKEERKRFAVAFDAVHQNVNEYYFKNIGLHMLASLMPWPFAKLNGAPGLFHTIHRKFDPAGRAFATNVQIVQEFVKKFVQKKREDPTLPQQRDLLALFMNAEDDEGVSLCEPKHQAYIENVAVGLMLAGAQSSQLQTFH